MRINFKSKEEIIDEILCRWWYGLPEYPPLNYDYEPKLKENKLRKVNADAWLIEKDETPEGLRKCKEVTSYPGVFIDYENILYDLRPKELCPSKDNFNKKAIIELQETLKRCYEGQIKALEPIKDKDLHFTKAFNEVSGKIRRLAGLSGLVDKK